MQYSKGVQKNGVGRSYALDLRGARRNFIGTPPTNIRMLHANGVCIANACDEGKPFLTLPLLLKSNYSKSVSYASSVKCEIIS